MFFFQVHSAVRIYMTISLFHSSNSPCGSIKARFGGVSLYFAKLRLFHHSLILYLLITSEVFDVLRKKTSLNVRGQRLRELIREYYFSRCYTTGQIV